MSHLNRTNDHNEIRKGSVGHAVAAAAKLGQPCPTLCDPTDGSPQGSPVPGILQETIMGCHFSPVHESEK